MDLRAVASNIIVLCTSVKQCAPSNRSADKAIPKNRNVR